MGEYTANDQGYAFGPNILWWNREGIFEKITLYLSNANSMGAHTGDYNRDGWLDLISSDVD